MINTESKPDNSLKSFEAPDLISAFDIIRRELSGSANYVLTISGTEEQPLAIEIKRTNASQEKIEKSNKPIRIPITLYDLSW